MYGSGAWIGMRVTRTQEVLIRILEVRIQAKHEFSGAELGVPNFLTFV